MRKIYCISDFECHYLSCLNDFDHNPALNTEGMLYWCGFGHAYATNHCGYHQDHRDGRTAQGKDPSKQATHSYILNMCILFKFPT